MRATQVCCRAPRHCRPIKLTYARLTSSSRKLPNGNADVFALESNLNRFVALAENGTVPAHGSTAQSGLLVHAPAPARHCV